MARHWLASFIAVVLLAGCEGTQSTSHDKSMPRMAAADPSNARPADAVARPPAAGYRCGARRVAFDGVCRSAGYFERFTEPGGQLLVVLASPVVGTDDRQFLIVERLSPFVTQFTQYRKVDTARPRSAALGPSARAVSAVRETHFVPTDGVWGVDREVLKPRRFPQPRRGIGANAIRTGYTGFRVYSASEWADCTHPETGCNRVIAGSTAGSTSSTLLDAKLVDNAWCRLQLLQGMSQASGLVAVALMAPGFNVGAAGAAIAFLEGTAFVGSGVTMASAVGAVDTLITICENNAEINRAIVSSIVDGRWPIVPRLDELEYADPFYRPKEDDGYCQPERLATLSIQETTAEYEVNGNWVTVECLYVTKGLIECTDDGARCQCSPPSVTTCYRYCGETNEVIDCD